MQKELSQETLIALATIGKLLGAAEFHFVGVRVCDNCQDDTKEAFPYHVRDRHGDIWNDLCNGCFDLLGCAYPDDDQSKNDDQDQTNWRLSMNQPISNEELSYLILNSLVEERITETIDDIDRAAIAAHVGMRTDQQIILNFLEKYRPTPPTLPGIDLPGLTLIAAERRRQIEQEGRSAKYDDRHNTNGELVGAAVSYAIARGKDDPTRSVHWPWGEMQWKPKDRLRNLVRAGALLAAEIDRLLRQKQGAATPQTQPGWSGDYGGPGCDSVDI